MTTGGLAIERKPASLQLPNDLSIPESREAAHSCGDYNRVVSPIIGSRQVRNTVALAPSFNQFPGDIARDVERLGNGSALGYKTRKFIRGRKEHALGQFLDLYLNREFHTS